MLSISYDYFIKVGILTKDTKWTTRLKTFLKSALYLTTLIFGFASAAAYAVHHISDDFANSLISMAGCFISMAGCIKHCLVKYNEGKLRDIIKSFNDLVDDGKNHDMYRVA